MSMAVEIEEFIAEEIAPGRGVESLDPGADLLAGEVIDSLGIVELISFLESSYGIEVADDDLDPDNFRSVERIVRFVERKRA